MEKLNSKTILFIHGAFVTKNCWSEWKTYFDSKGYVCIVPAWPNKEATAEVLRARHPDANVAALRLKTLLEYYADIIKKLPEKPILIGHSIGGLLVQLLVQRELAVAGIAIHSAPPQGLISFQFSFYRSLFKPLGLFTSTKKTYLMRLNEWQYVFTNGMTLNDQKKSYHKYAIPESKLLLRDCLTRTAHINFRNKHVPLLFIAGTIDNVTPAALNLANFNRYKDSESTTEYKEFEGRNHFVLQLQSWKEEANYIMQWIDTHVNPNTPEFKHRLRQRGKVKSSI